MQSYKLHVVQALYAGGRAKRVEFCNTILRDMEDDNFLPSLIFDMSAVKLTVTTS